jgi:hypothetical protein
MGYVYVARLPPAPFPPPPPVPRADGNRNGAIAQRAGSIDSLAPARSPLRGFVHVARLPPAPLIRFLRKAHPYGLRPCRSAPAGSIDSLSPESSPLWATSMSLGSRRLHSRPASDSCAALFWNRDFAGQGSVDIFWNYVKKASCCGFLDVLCHRFAIECDSILPLL